MQHKLHQNFPQLQSYFTLPYFSKQADNEVIQELMCLLDVKSPDRLAEIFNREYPCIMPQVVYITEKVETDEDLEVFQLSTHKKHLYKLATTFEVWNSLTRQHSSYFKQVTYCLT